MPAYQVMNKSQTMRKLENQPAAYVLANRKAQYRSGCGKIKSELRHIMAELGFLHKLKFLEILGI